MEWKWSEENQKEVKRSGNGVKRVIKRMKKEYKGVKME